MKSIPFRADKYAVLRFPILPDRTLSELEKEAGDALDSIVQSYFADPYVREAIFLASPSLHEKAKAWEQGGAEYGDISRSLARYLLRMAFRPTPFGTCSGVAACQLGPGGETRLELPTRNRLNRLVQLDSGALTRLTMKVCADPSARESIRYAVNDTAVLKDDVLTFTAFERTQKLKRIYRQVEIEASPYLDVVLKYATSPRRVGDIAQTVSASFPEEVTPGDAVAFVWQLIQTQVLCSDHLTDLTESDNLSALSRELQMEGSLSEAISGIRDIVNGLQGNHPVDMEVYSSISKSLALIDVRTDKDAPVKADLFADHASRFSLSQKTVHQIERAVNDVTRIMKKKTRLNDFARVFVEIYGECEVPLSMVANNLEALGFSERSSSLPAISRVVRGKRTWRSSYDTDNTLNDAITSGLLEDSAGVYSDITTVVERYEPSGHVGAHDATVVAWVSIWRDANHPDPVVEIKSVGSQEPGRVMGRFAFGLPVIAEYLRETCSASRYPIVELVHQPADRIGNICSRPTLSDYEFRIRGGSPSGAMRISMDDLSVSVVQDRVVVRSRSLGSPVAIRMSNAHAFDRQENLAVYRFLNYVSNQDYLAECVNLTKRLPNSGFVPGMKYRGVIVGRPHWRLSNKEVKALKKLGSLAARQAIRDLAAERRMPRWVSLVNGENGIPYSLHSDWMVDDLLRQIFKAGYATISDVYPEDMAPYSESASGLHFHEIQIALRATRPHAAIGEPDLVGFTPNAIAPIWSSWAYFKIYAVPHVQTSLLLEMRPVVERLRSESIVHDFFYIRYRDDIGAHLRLRFHVRGDQATEKVLAKVAGTFEVWHTRGLAQRITMEPYVREVSRYGGDERCAVCEEIFSLDSSVVLEALSKLTPVALTFWHQAAAAVDCMLLSLGIASLCDRFAFSQRAAAEFAQEMDFSSEERKRIGGIFRDTGPLPVGADGVIDMHNIPGADIFRAKERQFRTLWKKFSSISPPLDDEKLYRVRWSLVHMRLNRILDRDQRFQEAVIWELLKRSYAGAVKGQRP